MSRGRAGVPPLVVLAAVAALAVVAAGCPSNAPPRMDAASDARATDGMVAREAAAGGLALDFTVTGCPRLERTPRCTGRAPLTLEFVPINSGGITKYLWNFGDGTPEVADTSPVHTYNLPGTYDVGLVGGGSTDGTAQRKRQGFVVVTESAAGDPCEVDLQCARGMTCVCGSATKCTSAFVRGMCAATCKDAPCAAGQVCADLSLAARDGGTAEAWEVPLCLRACRSDDECGAGTTCRDLPGTGAAGGWVRGCFPAHPLALGASCRGATGQLRHELCVTGLCADLGANGVCSQDCSRLPCPTGSACAQLNDGRRLCLRVCGAAFPCSADPLLACLPPNSGPLGFTVGSPVADGGAPLPSATYCAPRRCSMPSDCAPSGLCREAAPDAHCVRR